MKKRYFLSVMIAIAPILNQVKAQTATNTFPSTGNVGIGTTSPFSQLHVNAGTDRNFLIRSAGVFGVGVAGIGIQSVNDAGNANQPIEIEASTLLLNGATGGNVGVGTTTPQALLHIAGGGVSTNSSSQYSGNLIIQGDDGTRSATVGASLEFVIPANTDGTNLWGQGRITTVAGSVGSPEAVGKMILGTRRYFNKTGAGTNWYYGDDMTIDGAGNVGIGTITPQSSLTVYQAGSSASQWRGRVDFGGDITKVVAGEYDGVAFLGAHNAALSAWANLVINADGGNVGIGTRTPAEKLSVNGNIRSKKMIITQTGWPDYVFDSSYNLPSLTQVEQFIKDNKHLPGVLSADEVQKNGLNLGDNQAALLQKIEELTLYMIEQGKKIDAMKKENDEMKKDNQEIKEQNKQLQLQVEKLGNNKQ